MNISAPFIKRPVGTSLLAAALLLSGALAFRFLPVAPLPQVEFPVISVSVGLPGASPETMASAVATPLERQFGRIAALNQANANTPKGELGDAANAWAIHDNDQIFLSDQYRNLIVAYKNGAPVRLADVADVQDAVEDIHVVGLANGKPGLVMVISRQPGANIIATVDRVYAALPQLQASISPAIALSVVLDRTTTVRASVRDIEL